MSGLQQNSLAKERELVPETFSGVVFKVAGEVPPLGPKFGVGSVVPGKDPFPGPDSLSPFSQRKDRGGSDKNGYTDNKK
jgi:hypothetical protein